MSERTQFASHEQYISAAPMEAQEILLEIQKLVEAAVPKAERCIAYSMPAFRAGKVFFYFAAFKNHVGVYPPVTDDAALIQESSRYRNEKGNLAFKYKEPVPYDLIRRVAVALFDQYTRK